MKNKDIEDPFYLQIQRGINLTERKSNLLTSIFYVIRISQILLAGTITVYSGISENKTSSSEHASNPSSNPQATGAKAIDSTPINYILILGAITTALTAMDTLLQVEAKKGTYKLALFELRSIRTEYVYKRLDGNEIKDSKFLDDLFERYKKANSYGLNLSGPDAYGGGQG